MSATNLSPFQIPPPVHSVSEEHPSESQAASYNLPGSSSATPPSTAATLQPLLSSPVPRLSGAHFARPSGHLLIRSSSNRCSSYGTRSCLPTTFTPSAPFTLTPCFRPTGAHPSRAVLAISLHLPILLFRPHVPLLSGSCLVVAARPPFCSTGLCDSHCHSHRCPQHRPSVLQPIGSSRRARPSLTCRASSHQLFGGFLLHPLYQSEVSATHSLLYSPAADVPAVWNQIHLTILWVSPTSTALVLGQKNAAGQNKQMAVGTKKKSIRDQKKNSIRDKLKSDKRDRKGWGPDRRGFTLRVLALQKHHRNSTRRHPERQKKNENGSGRGEKRAKFWAVRGGRERRSRGRAVLREGGPHNLNKHTNTHTRQHTHTHRCPSCCPQFRLLFCPDVVCFFPACLFFLSFVSRRLFACFVPPPLHQLRCLVHDPLSLSGNSQEVARR